MRKVECTTVKYSYENGNRIGTKEVSSGLFHQWGCCFEEFETGAGNYSVAIVELEDGTIREFLPTEVKFISAA
ncbi:hypothetical protein ACUNE0_11650 [Serratia sp. IR-2025]